MNERPITFNHGYLCQMLRAASEFDLANVILDVKKEQKRRADEERQVYAERIMKAIHEAVESGYIVNFFSDCANEGYPELSIHCNNLSLTYVDIKEEGEEED